LIDSYGIWLKKKPPKIRVVFGGLQFDGAETSVSANIYLT